jgi:hypothetical protein
VKPLARRDAESLAAFLRQKRFRSRMSNYAHACIVRGFLQFLGSMEVRQPSRL